MNSAVYRQCINTRKQQAGLSLVELMIAMALGVVLSLGIAQVFLGSSKTYRTSGAIAYLQENLRFSLARISSDVRMAGYTGCLVGEPTDHLKPSSNDEFWDAGRAVIGWEAPGTGLGDELAITGFSEGGGNWSNGASDTVPTEITSEAVPGTDIIVLTGSERENVTPKENSGGNATIGIEEKESGIDKNSIVVVVTEDCSGGDRFQTVNNPNASTITKSKGGGGGNVQGGDLLTYTNDASVFSYYTRGYFIGKGASSTPGEFEPALFRVELTPEADKKPVELVSGVESMQVLYGVANSDRRAERYVDASAVTNWEDVVSVRIALLMRSDDGILDEDNSQTFNLVGTEVDPGADRRARLVATTTVGIRNRLE